MQKQYLFKKVFFLLLSFFVLTITNAQTGLNFQGVARNSSNVILASQQISLRLSILQGSATGNAEYTEVRKANTNAQGLFTAVIGDTGAISVLGNFATINWKSNPKFLKIEMDVAAGNNFITMGTTQFQSVAYAQFANSVDAENIAGIVPVARGGTGANSLAGLKAALALDKTSVGLSNVENTALSTWTGNDNITKVGTIVSGVWGGDVIAVNAGGTGGSSASQARTNLGLVIGTNVQGVLTPGVDYLTPTGSAINLSNFPVLNQSTTGNAATATLADRATVSNNTNATSNTTLTSLPNLAEVGTITSGTWNGAIIDIAHGGTGTSTANFVDLISDQTILGTKYFLADANINGLTVGKGAGSIASNTTLGRNAFSSNISGFDNTAIGLFSLYSNLDGISNTAIGRYSLYANTIGKFNTGIGTNALSSNSDGEFNSSLGALTLNGNTSGKYNTAIGYSALQLNSTAEGNTATGAIALNSNTTGENNTATGAYALNSNITGYDNTAIGYSSLVSLTSGDDNTSIGSGADVSVGNLTNATAIGAFAIVKASNTIQLGNTFVENVVTSGTISATGFVSATGYGTASGTSAQFLKADGSIDGTPYVNKNNSTIAMGNEAGYERQGISAIAMGEYTGYSDQSPNAIAIGTNAGLTSQGASSIGIGMYAGQTSQGHKAIAMGVLSGQTSQGISAIAIGDEAGKTNQQSSAIAIGLNAGNNAQGANSIAIGTSAGIYSQTANSIILNATGSDLNASTTGFFVAPIRLSTPTSPVYYDLATKEITYGTTIDAGALTGTTAVANGGTGLTSPGTTGNVLTSNGTNWVSAPISSSVDLTTAQTVSGSKSFTSDMRVGTATPTSSAVLEVSSTTQGFLPPRMTLTQRNAISSPAIGLMIFCTNCTPKGDPEYYNGTRWTSMLSAAPLANTIIGDQVWSSTNLNVGKYRNGDVIPQVTGTAWSGLTTGAWCWYNDDSVTYAATYGKLYNWHAVNDPRGLAPLGWHIPTLAEWAILTDYLGGTTVAGGAMKQTGTSLWTTPNTSATNTSGFTGLPGGVRNASTNNFTQRGEFGHWWSASNYATTHAWSPYLYYNDSNSSITYHQMNDGLSVRCVRD